MDGEPDITQPLKSHVEAAPRDGDPVVEAPKEAHTLLDLAEDHEFFTPALVVTHGGFDRDPVQEYLRSHRVAPEHRPMSLDLVRPVFQGLPTTVFPGEVQPINWNRRLYMVPKPAWAPCREAIARIAIRDQGKQHYARVFMHALRVVDPVALAKVAVVEEIPTIVVTIFGVTTNKQFVYMVAAHDPPRTQAYAWPCKPDPGMVEEARKVLGPPPDPATIG